MDEPNRPEGSALRPARVGVSIDELAGGLGVTRQAVEAMIRRGELDAVRVGRRRVVTRPALAHAFGAATADAVLSAAR